MPSNLLPCDSTPILALKVKMHCGFKKVATTLGLQPEICDVMPWANINTHQHVMWGLQPMAWQPKRPTHRHVLLNVGPVPQPAQRHVVLWTSRSFDKVRQSHRWICEVFFTFDTSVVPTKLIQLHNGIVRKTGCLPTSQHKPKLRPPIPFLQPGQVRETWRNLQQCVNLSASKIKLKCDKFNTTNTTNI